MPKLAVEMALLAIQTIMGQGDNGLSNTGGDQIARAGAANTVETNYQNRV